MPEPRVTAMQIRTSRTATFARQLLGRQDSEPVVLIHGNLSSSVFLEPLMRLMPGRYQPIALDLRGFGGSDPEPVDATRGVRDFSDDLLATLDALDIGQAHLLGWSLGGSVVFQAAIDAPQRILSMTVVAPISPFGFGGTIDAAGTLLADDGAGSGAGMVSKDFVRSLADHDTSDSGARAMLRQWYVGADVAVSGEDDLLGAILATALGPDHYPGDYLESDHWPGRAPGSRGVMNAISPKYLDVSGIAEIDPKPAVLWIRGDRDRIVSDESVMDPAARGKRGAIDGYPGVEIAPPQPMIGQTRAVLDRYAAAGGRVREVIIEGAAHAPHLTALPEFVEALIPHLDGAIRE